MVGSFVISAIVGLRLFGAVSSTAGSRTHDVFSGECTESTSVRGVLMMSFYSALLFLTWTCSFSCKTKVF